MSTALGLIAEIGDFARFSHPRELASWLGITPSEYSSGDQQHRRRRVSELWSSPGLVDTG
jgi:transposase